MKTMKKTYFNPELIVVKIQPSQMLAASGDESLGLKDGNATEFGARDGDFDEE